MLSNLRKFLQFCKSVWAPPPFGGLVWWSSRARTWQFNFSADYCDWFLQFGRARSSARPPAKHATGLTARLSWWPGPRLGSQQRSKWWLCALREFLLASNPTRPIEVPYGVCSPTPGTTEPLSAGQPCVTGWKVRSFVGFAPEQSAARAIGTRILG